ncbi:MAG: hypothetical protein KF822_07555 [Steroidobacteraceae bacterium]|nr:hypothetical protein [Steroidobacteraceae bacterium]
MSGQHGRRRRPRKIIVMTAAERMRRWRERRRARGLKPVVCWMPRRRVAAPLSLDRRLLEARSLALHVMVAFKIDGNPGLLDVAHRNLARWRERGSGAHGASKRAWSAVLDRPWPEIAALITEQSERAVRLRQITPFLGVLAPREKMRIYSAFRALQRVM